MNIDRFALCLALSMASILSVRAAIELTNTNIVGTGNYAYLNATGEDLSINGSSVTGKKGVVVSGDTYAGEDLKGWIGLVNVNSYVGSTNSTFKGGDGGYVKVSTISRSVTATGGLGLGIANSQLTLMDSTVTGGDGGTIIVPTSTFSATASGGSGLLLSGAAGFEYLGSTTVTGGKGGSVEVGTAATAVAIANGGAAIEAQGATSVIDQGAFVGGQGGAATGASTSQATGGSALKITSPGGTETSDLRIEGGSFTGGQGGTVNGVAGKKGAAIELAGLGSLAIAGGTLDGAVLISGGTSTLSLESTYTDAVTLRQTGGTVTVDMWNDGQLSDTIITSGTMNLSGAFNLDGIFELGSATAAANFNGGLMVAGGSTLDLGLGTAGMTDGEFDTDSAVSSDYDGSNLGSITASGDLNFADNVKWTINAGDTAVASNHKFNLATDSGSVTNLPGVKFNGTNGEGGWLGGISDVSMVGNILQATFGTADIDEALGVDESTMFGRAMIDLADLLSPAAKDQLASLANSAEEAGWMMTNGYIRTAEMSGTLIGLQSIFADQLRNRTRSMLHYDEIGYPAASTPSGAAGWDSVRRTSDRWEENEFGKIMTGDTESVRRTSDRWEEYTFGEIMTGDTEGMRHFSDRVEENFGYDEVEGFVDSIVPDVHADSTMVPHEWQAWGSAYGSSIDQQNTDGFAGYEATIGGVLLGMDKRISDNMLIGIDGGIAHTVLDGNEGRDAKANTFNVAAYLATHGEHLFVDASATYAFNMVDSEYEILGYTSDYNAHTMGLYVGGGYAINVSDAVILTPEASVLGTLYTRGGYDEKSSLAMPTLNWDDYDETSILSKLGATLTSLYQLDWDAYEIGFQPELRAHWLHEFNADMDEETYRMEGGTYDLAAALLSREEDLVRVGGGMRISKWAVDDTEFGVDVDVTLGNDYEAYIVSGKFVHRF